MQLSAKFPRYVGAWEHCGTSRDSCCRPLQERRIESTNPVMLRKAIKNETEIECMRRAHVSVGAMVLLWQGWPFSGLSARFQIKDAVALCEFFVWMESQVPKGEVTEITAAAKLEHFRRCVGCLPARHTLTL